MAFQKLSPDLIRMHKGVSFPGVSIIFICHDGKGNVFLTKRSQKNRDERGRWEFGGGGMKQGQSVEENLIRELKEEYDVVPLKIDFIGYTDVFDKTPDGTPTQWIALNFAILVDPKKLQIMEPDMVDDYGWFTVDNLPSPTHSKFPLFFERHGKKLERMLRSAR